MRMLLTTVEAAEYLRVHPSTIRRWTQVPGVPQVRLGGRVLFDRDELDAWIDACKQELLVGPREPRSGESADPGEAGPARSVRFPDSDGVA